MEHSLLEFSMRSQTMTERCPGHLTSQLTASIKHQVWERLSHNHPTEPIHLRTVRKKDKGSLF